MKKVRHLLILIFFIILSSFDFSSKRKIIIELHIECCFNQENVKIFFDNKTVYNKKKVTTEESTGVADYFKIKTQNGIHKIGYKVDNLPTKSYIFSTDSCSNDTLYFGLQNYEKNLYLEFYKNKPEYD